MNSANSNITNSFVQVRVWLIVHAVTLVFGPVASKAWRVYQIFTYGFGKRLVIRDGRLFLVLLALLVVDAVLMALWQTIDPVKLQLTDITVTVILEHNTNDTQKPKTTSVPECACSKYAIWISLHVLWKMCIIAACLYFAWKTKHVSVPGLNESKNIVAAIFVCLIVTSCAAMMRLGLHDAPNAVSIVTAIVLAAYAAFVQLILFLPKVNYWWKTPNDVSTRISTSSLKEIASAVIPQVGVGDYNGNICPDDGIAEIVEENKILRESIAEKEGLISALQSHLDIAKVHLSKLPTEAEFAKNADDASDTSSGTHENPDGDYDVLRTPRLAERHEVRDICKLRTDNDKLAETGEEIFCQTDVQPPTRSSSMLSVSSKRSFVAEFTDIRTSLSAELDSAQCIHNNLKNSFSLNMGGTLNETEWLYETNSNTDSVADSIVQSFNLGGNRDVMSYLKSHLPHENSVIKVRRSRRPSTSSSVMSVQSNGSVNNNKHPEDILTEIPGIQRDSATPTSQQHADILRYYSYRHMNDGFQQFRTFRINQESRRPSFKSHFKKPTKIEQEQTTMTSHFPGYHVDRSAIYAVSNVIRKPPRTFQANELQTDSFV
ncbi:hypothetical protein DPMN_031589 [Dreissena polymorpha]|uniref:G-protein coupled receptors family 3 profile domain-containing protein n=1 Tax=Dreissena polymorpha TaxID=45954 RepID=A0A9D4M2S8_DREPO|nr:hypothetical protein DPMN_031589 [Dreissena polymorpha]